jgi:hypothetical protein
MRCSLACGVRYISQLLYGCQNPSCTTPTCFSCRRRITVAPLRRLTPVSARTIACYLASRDDAEKALCPHKPVIPIDTKSARAKHGNRARSGRTGKAEVGSGETEETDLGPALKRDTDSNNARTKPTESSEAKPTPTPPDGTESADPSDETKREKSKTGPGFLGRKQTRRDPKSFTQNLFDTFHLRMLEWLSLPKAAHAFAFAPEGKEDEYSPKPPIPPQKSDRLAMGESPKKCSVPMSQPKPQEAIPSSNITTIAKSHSDGHSISIQTPSSPTQQADCEPPPTAVSLAASPKVRRRRSLGHPDMHRQQSPQAIKEKLQPQGFPRQPRLPPPVTPYSHSGDMGPPSLPPSINRHHQQAQHSGLVKGYNVMGKKHENHRRNSWNGAKMPQLPQTTPSRISEKDLASKDRNLIETPRGSTITETEKAPTNGPYFIRPPQSLARLSCDAIEALIQLVESTDTVPKEERVFTRSFGTVKAAQKAVLKHIDNLKHPDLTIGGLIEDLTRLRHNPHVEAERFAEQSIFYVLSNPSAILESFTDGESEASDGHHERTLVRPHPIDVDEAFRLLMRKNSALIFNSLWLAIESLFTAPPELIPPSTRLKAAISTSLPYTPSSPIEASLRAPSPKARYFTDPEAAHIVIICLHALVAGLPKATPETWLAIHKLRAEGKVVPDSNLVGADMGPVSSMMEAIEVLEDEMALRLVKRLTRAVAARTYFAEVMKTKSRKGKGSRDKRRDRRGVMEIVCDHFARCGKVGSNSPRRGAKKFPPGWGEGEDPTGWSIPALMLEWIRSALIKEWDGKEEVSRWSIAGGAIGMLSSLCECQSYLILHLGR